MVTNTNVRLNLRLNFTTALLVLKEDLFIESSVRTHLRCYKYFKNENGLFLQIIKILSFIYTAMKNLHVFWIETSVSLFVQIGRVVNVNELIDLDPFNCIIKWRSLC